MIQISNKQIIQAAFNVALFDINNINCQKHANSRYKPLVSTTMKTKWNGKSLLCNFTNNKIFSIGNGDDVDVLKSRDDVSIELKKNFNSFDDTVDYFTHVIHHKIFKSNSKNEAN